MSSPFFDEDDEDIFAINVGSAGWGLFKLMWVIVLAVVVVSIVPKPAHEQKQVAPPPGNVCVTIDWDHGVDKNDSAHGDIDVDLWAQAPGDHDPVGYSHLGDLTSNLNRDDTGNPDPDKNFEMWCTRGIKAGKYIANAHLYGNRSVLKEIHVHASVTVMKQAGPNAKGGSHEILKTDVVLTKPWGETTLFNFTLTADGELVPDSVNTIYHRLQPNELSTGSNSGHPGTGGMY
ncbi:MAG TPA: hypothetical protein VMU27_03420 [Candidatus Paceibacterota bacterium]|nr:hypothetical protein [Candidatus Paceibacterota bacterium]